MAHPPRAARIAADVELYYRLYLLASGRLLERPGRKRQMAGSDEGLVPRMPQLQQDRQSATATPRQEAVDRDLQTRHLHPVRFPPQPPARGRLRNHGTATRANIEQGEV